MKSREPKLQSNTLKNILQKNTYWYGMNALNGEQERGREEFMSYLQNNGPDNLHFKGKSIF